MEAGYRRSDDLFMAFTASRRRIGKSGIPDDTLMSGLPISISGITPVAVFTGNLTMVTFQKGRLNIYLFVKLQRSQGATSPFSGCFGRLLVLGLESLYFPAQPDQLFQISVTLDALTRAGLRCNCQGRV